MKSILNKIFNGMLYGIGFGLITGGIYYYVVIKTTEDAMSRYSFEDGAVEIIEHRKIERNDRLVILGKVTNVSDKPANNVTVNVDLFLNGDFVKQCDELIKGEISAGASRNFELVCGCCNNAPIVEHDSYEVYLTGF
ncbi:FxLYD domain-containing protein [Pseudomonas sp. EA_35y_Pfl2_R111]|uniref:FxLYD domain-containing protein n=1 Tax=Pseudomonas sp. EA_35y_Pfl2_R111 TaxID=3088689 RepID=UPI0030D92703